MPITEEETSFLYKLDIDSYLKKGDKKLSTSEKNEIKELVGEHLINNILEKVADSHSPVTGRKFKQLNEEYAEREKNGDRDANLDLFGDMLNSLEYKVKRNGIEIGIYDEDQAIKSYAHNTGFKGHPVLADKGLKRQFIPNKGENFTKSVLSGVRDVIEEYLEARNED